MLCGGATAVALGFVGVVSRGSMSRDPSSDDSDVSRSGTDFEKKVGIGKAEGAGDAWKVGPA